MSLRSGAMALRRHWKYRRYPYSNRPSQSLIVSIPLFRKIIDEVVRQLKPQVSIDLGYDLLVSRRKLLDNKNRHWITSGAHVRPYSTPRQKPRQSYYPLLSHPTFKPQLFAAAVPTVVPHKMAETGNPLTPKFAPFFAMVRPTTRAITPAAGGQVLILDTGRNSSSDDLRLRRRSIRHSKVRNRYWRCGNISTRSNHEGTTSDWRRGGQTGQYQATFEAILIYSPTVPHPRRHVRNHCSLRPSDKRVDSRKVAAGREYGAF